MDDIYLKNKLATEYLEKTLTPVELKKFVEECFDYSVANFPSAAAQHRDRSIKKVREEAYPLSILIENSLLEVKSITPSKEGTNFDAGIELHDQTKLHAEITTTKDGEFNLFVFEHLDKYGNAPLGGISKKDLLNGINGDEAVFGDAIDVAESCTELEKAVRKQVAAKQKKKYPSPCVLIVVIEDDFRETTFRMIAASLKNMEHGNFQDIYLVGFGTKLAARL